MITWNYRVFQEANGDRIIREVFYAEAGSIVACTENAVEPKGRFSFGDATRTLEELARDIESFKQALMLPTLTLADIPANQMKPNRSQKQNNNISHKQLIAELGLDLPSDDIIGG
ncbi:hypothetical protein [Microseira sp. BLCC-F43]|jgi:hypothetical protein|uniref:hypothetical protein n=1 Tax=Microseira sp. BLCC-F43 TaxID=3153602 RepID=UPI0035B84EFA